MLREIVKEVGRYKEGDQHDYPKGVWDKIAVDAKMDLDEFSTLVDSNPALRSTTRSRFPVRKRLGAA